MSLLRCGYNSQSEGPEQTTPADVPAPTENNELEEKVDYLIAQMEKLLAALAKIGREEKEEEKAPRAKKGPSAEKEDNS